jgi:hypothetical protein
MLWITLALATNPGTVPVQGVLADGDAVTTGTRALTFKLLGGASCATERWTETRAVALDHGLFSVSLGEVSTLDLGLFAEADLCLTVAVDGGAASTPVKLATAPYAAYAQDSARLGGLEADRYVADDEVRPWSSLSLAGAPAWVRDGYAVGGGLSLSGTTLSAQPPYAIGSGLNLTGNTLSAPTPYAVGSGLALTGNTLSAVGYSAGAGLTLTGTVFSASGTPTFDGLKLGTVAGNCTTAAERGTLRYDATTGAFQACTPSGWATFAAVRDGSSANTASASCTQLKADIPSASNGAFWLDPNLGSSVDAFQAWCDFTAAGGPYVYRNYQDLRAYYSFDSATPATADWGSYAGTFAGAASAAAFPPYTGFGKSAAFNNADTTYFALSPAVPFGAVSTLVFWARSTACNNNEIAFYMGGTSDWGADLVYAGTRLTLSGSDRLPLGANTCAQDVWAHYAYVDTGTELRGYKNGSLLGTHTSYVSLSTKSLTHLGGFPGHGTNVLGGHVDDVAVFGRALSAAEISAIYTLGTQGKPLRHPN